MTFKRFITIYSILLAVLMGCFLIYVLDSLVKYENNQLDNYMTNFIDDLKDADDSGLAYLAKNDSLTYQQSVESKDADSPVFDVYDGDAPLLRVTLGKKESTTRLGLLSFNIWDVKDVKRLNKEGLFNFEVTVPVSCTVEVNGKKLTEKEYIDTTKFTGLADLGKQLDLGYQVTYLVKGLTDAPEVKVTGRDGKPIEFNTKGSKLSIEVPCEKYADVAAAKGKIRNFPDVQEIARQWSLYLTNDLAGGHEGFDTLKEYLIEGTYLYQYAYNWSVSVDRKFTTSHRFAKEMFSEEKVCNFKVYSDREFSCDVFLQKNMLIYSRTHVDKMGEHMHFVYYDDTDDGTDNPQWKLVSMKAVTVK